MVRPAAPGRPHFATAAGRAGCPGSASKGGPRHEAACELGVCCLGDAPRAPLPTAVPTARAFLAPRLKMVVLFLD